MQIDIPSYPWALFDFSVLMNFITSALKSKAESLFSVSKVGFVERELLLTIVMHYLQESVKVDYQLIAVVVGESQNRLQ